MIVKSNSESLIWKIVTYTMLVSFTILTITPLVWLFYSSLKSNAEIVQNAWALPQSFNFSNFTRAWKLGNMGTLILNSIFYSLVSTIITVYLASSAGYAFATFSFKINKFLYSFFLMGLLITVHAVLVPLFLMENAVGLDNTRLGIILPYVAFGLPFLIYLATSYIKGIPLALVEAATIDGAGHIKIFHSIILPMSKPIVTTMAIFSFLGNWNEFVFVFVLTNKESLRSLPVGVNAFAGGLARNFGLLFAALVIAIIPMLVFYAIFYRMIIESFASGALKE